MKKIGLTGGIATGKSTATKTLRKMGYSVVDADEIVHDMEKSQGALTLAIARDFGTDKLLPDGSVNRQALAALVFNDKSARKCLQELTDEIVRPEILRQVAASPGDIVFADIPLLFEQDYAKEFDETWLVYASQDVQVARLMARNGYTETQALARLAAQLPIEEKKELADVILDNTRDLSDLKHQIEAALS
ncbi:MAG: dephospho-CoA kinase [Streptococcaceae bacterium]|jgi:dephospho-CoA kinase|nr:dephospho-CoA kinase [Streptococcaceae bacterium]